MTPDNGNAQPADSPGAPDSIGAAAKKEKRLPAWCGWLAAGALVLMLFLVLYTLREYKAAWPTDARPGAQTP